MQKFINDIRESDQETKLRWIILFTSVSVVIILILWAFYLKGIIASSTNESRLASNVDPSPEVEVLSQVETDISASFKNFRARISDALWFLQSSARKANEINIENPEN